jgi:hypothetical protein
VDRRVFRYSTRYFSSALLAPFGASRLRERGVATQLRLGVVRASGPALGSLPAEEVRCGFGRTAPPVTGAPVRRDHSHPRSLRTRKQQEGNGCGDTVRLSMREDFEGYETHRAEQAQDLIWISKADQAGVKCGEPQDRL